MEHSIDFWELLKQGKVTVTHLNTDYEFKSFNCGNTDLNDFLFADSKIYLKYLRYTTTLLETENRIIAYYSLANDLLKISDRQDFQDQGIGTFLIKSLVQSFIRKNKTGCQFITVDAINDNTQRTIKFYENNGFKYLTMNDVNRESRQMYKSLLEYI